MLTLLGLMPFEMRKKVPREQPGKHTVLQSPHIFDFAWHLIARRGDFMAGQLRRLRAAHTLFLPLIADCGWGLAVYFSALCPGFKKLLHGLCLTFARASADLSDCADHRHPGQTHWIFHEEAMVKNEEAVPSTLEKKENSGLGELQLETSLVFPVCCRMWCPRALSSSRGTPSTMPRNFSSGCWIEFTRTSTISLTQTSGLLGRYTATARHCIHTAVHLHAEKHSSQLADTYVS